MRNLPLKFLFTLLGAFCLVPAFAQESPLELGGSLTASSSRIHSNNQSFKVANLSIAPWISIDLSEILNVGTSIVYTYGKEEDLYSESMWGVEPFVGLSFSLTERISYLPCLYVGAMKGTKYDQKATDLYAGIDFAVLRFWMNRHWAVNCTFGNLEIGRSHIQEERTTHNFDFHFFTANTLSLSYHF